MNTATMFVNLFFILLLLLLPSFFTLVHRLRRLLLIVHILHLPLFLRVEKSSTTFMLLLKVKVVSTNLFLFGAIVSVSVDLLL